LSKKIQENNESDQYMTQVPLFTMPFIRLMLSQGFQSLGYASMILLPLYLADIGGTKTQIGLLMSVGTIGGIVSRPLVAWSLDRFGRKPALLIGTILLSLGIFLLSWTREISTALVLIRFMIGIGVGALFSTYFTLASDWVPAQRRTEGLAIFGIFGLLPLCINPLISILGLSGRSLIYAFPYLSVLVLISFVLVYSLPEKQKAQYIAFSEYKALISRDLLPIWWATLFFAGWVGIYFSFATLCAQLTSKTPTYLWFFYAGSATILRIFGSHLLDRVKGGIGFWMIPALFLYALALFFLFLEIPYTAYISATFAGLGHGLCFPVCTSLLISRCPSHLKGAGMSMFTAIWDTSALLSVPTAGYLADLWDIQTMMIIAFMLFPISALGWVYLNRLKNKLI
jgi:MFS family permease